ncbi:MAG: cbb3-type cytochrome c oxidase subunit 3 [Phycisphaerales bacterium]|nr:cbb3-type cytochrome c oxidase subunit 3 [Phycisphaerales bacterium]
MTMNAVLAFVTDPTLLKGVGTAIFIAVYIGVIVKLLRMRPETSRRAARIPLDDDHPVEPRPHSTRAAATPPSTTGDLR